LSLKLEKVFFSFSVSIKTAKHNKAKAIKKNMADQNTDTAQVDENQMSTLEISITAILIVFILYMLKKLLFSS
jgi:hypothetical protein